MSEQQGQKIESTKTISDLGMGDNTDNSSILLHLLKLHLDFFLASITVILQSILGEGLLLALAPVLVEPSPHIFAEMLCPDRVESTKATRSLHIGNKSNNNNRGCLNNGDSLTCLLLV